MNKSIALTMLLCSSLVAAQEKEIWACQGLSNGSVGFVWRDRQWSDTLFLEENALFSLDVTESREVRAIATGIATVKVGESTEAYICRESLGLPGWFCYNDGHSKTFSINTNTGDAASSYLLGAVTRISSDVRGSPILNMYQCTKF